MKRITLVLAAITLALVSACGPRYETVPGDKLGTKIYTLDNGLKVYMSVNKEQPRIQTYIAVKVGSKNDPSETTGLAHYFEHLMFKGTQQFGTSDYAAEKPMLDQIEQLFEQYRATADEAERKAIYRQIDSISYEASKIAIPNEYDKLMAMIGADGTNAWTSADETVYTEDIPANQIDNWAKVQSDRFRNVVIRGFHTELETIYEEKNMSLTQDSRKIWEAVDKALFPNHPYGQQTTLGEQEHLKNPSITNVKNYHDQYYVPNNIAICLSGDFDPDEMVATIEKYFGDWEPNPSIPVLKYEQEKAISEPIVKEVYGLESESIAIAWRLPGTNDIKATAVASIAGSILSNGKAGLIDVNVIQAQRALSCYGGLSTSSDYSSFILMGSPKQGQSLDELKEVALEQIANMRSGNFDESLLSATINNLKRSEMRALESNSARARKYVDAFIAGVDWKDAARELDMLSEVTKEDVVAFANEYLSDNSYVIVYKRQGEDTSVQKIAAPAITPIVTNRDNQSEFVKAVAKSEVKPIEPVFVDFSKDMKQEQLAPGVELLYKQNEVNGIFSINFRFGHGLLDDPCLALAPDYLMYLGTPTMSATELASKFYQLACNYSFRVGSGSTILSISGLSENMEAALQLVEDFVANVQGDEQILANVKNDIYESRIRNKNSQSSCNSALLTYTIYGPEYVRNTTLTNDQIAAVTSDEILSKIRSLYAEGHQILYYGPMKDSEFKAALERHHKIDPAAVMGEIKHPLPQLTAESSVVLAQYDAKQIYYHQYSNRGELFDAQSAAVINLYNEYFGGGMNSIVFQEMREARGLAYSAYTFLLQPNYLDAGYYYRAFIATQNDKMRQAIEAFDDIINNMPVSEPAFDIAKDAIEGRMRTQRTTGAAVLNAYVDCRDLGISEPLDKQVFEQVQTLTLDDVLAAQQKWVKDRPYTYAILGDIKDIDTKYLKTLGGVKIVSLEDIFGY